MIPAALLETLLLGAGVLIGVVVIGAATGWLAASCEFPGRRMFEWALLLPLAMPAYIVAYAYTDALQFSGPVQAVLRESFDWEVGKLNAVTFDANGDRAACCSQTGDVVVWDVDR